ncbi:MAG: hypothetical protein ABI606_11855 [Rhodoferax sp.]
MQNKIATYLIALCALLMGATASFHAQAQSEASALSAVSAMPLASVVAGAMATVSVIGAGVVLSVAGEVIAFIPNALGRALLHNEHVTF